MSKNKNTVVTVNLCDAGISISISGVTIEDNLKSKLSELLLNMNSAVINDWREHDCVHSTEGKVSCTFNDQETVITINFSGFTVECEHAKLANTLEKRNSFTLSQFCGGLKKKF